MQPLGDRVDHEPRPRGARKFDQQLVRVAVFRLYDWVLLLAVIPAPEHGGVVALQGQFVEQPVALVVDDLVELLLGDGGVDDGCHGRDSNPWR